MAVIDFEFMHQQLARYLLASGQQGLSLPALHARLRQEGFPQVTAETVEHQLTKLASDGLVEERRGSGFSPAPRWRMTRDGEEQAKKEGIYA